jgi:uncharacterized surface protein with fasciclin (FAS1) repeats
MLLYLVSFALFAINVNSFVPKLNPKLGGSTALRANIVETATKSGNFKTLVAAIKAADLTSTLSGSGPFTVFAPTDEAFSKLPPGTVEALLKDIPKLKKILMYHVHGGAMNPTRNGRSLDTLLAGPDGHQKQLTIKVTNWSCETYIFGGQERPAYVTQIGVKCDNGLIHIIDEVLLPYEGNIPPKVTHIGARDKDKTQTLQMGYYGSQAGTGRNEVGTIVGAPPIRVGNAWRVAANYDEDIPVNK